MGSLLSPMVCNFQFRGVQAAIGLRGLAGRIEFVRLSRYSKRGPAAYFLQIWEILSPFGKLLLKPIQ